MTRSRWHIRTSGVVVAWLLAAALVSLAHRQLPAASWLLVHLVLLGAVSNAILVWSAHFAQAVLRAPGSGHRGLTMRLVAFNAGAVAVVAGVVAGMPTVLTAGAVLVAAALVVHAARFLVDLRRALPSRFGMTVHYYVAAALLAVPVVGLGVMLARGEAAPRILLAHATAGLLGWIGLPIIGTLLTLWPTMLHTRIAVGAERRAARALPVLVAATLVATAGLLAGRREIAVLGLLGYLAAAGWTLHSAVFEMTQKRPRSFAAWSTVAGVSWLGLGLVAFAAALLRPPGHDGLPTLGGVITAVVVAGGVLQILVGALAYLLPVMAGGGPRALRLRLARADRGAAARLLITNLGLLVCVLPSPSAVRVVASVAVLGALVSTTGALVAAVRPPRAVPGPAAHGHGAGLVLGLGVVMLAVVAGVAVDPTAVGSGAVQVASAAAGVQPTGRTTRVTVEVEGMRFSPSRVTVQAGDQLVLTVVNTGDDTHDLAMETGQRTPRLHPGQSATLDVGVVGRGLSGWCTVAGHRQMGMVLVIDAGVASPEGGVAAPAPEASAAVPDLMAAPGPAFTPYDARLAPAADTRTHRVRMAVSEQVVEVAPGVRQTRWTFNGTAPGPVLRGRVGDRFIITLVNDGSIGHSIDFHAGALAPDRPMRTIGPGEELAYRFTARRAGVWMYHCSTMPMSMHIANGMFGAVVIDPPGLTDVNEEFLLVQSEAYLGPPDGISDAARIAAGQADLVTFNGYPMQYDHHPLRAEAGDRVRFWVLAAGPNRGSAFHVVGGQFDTVYREGAYDLRPRAGGGAQVLGLHPAQGGFVELVMPEAGHYPFVTHAMSDAERGAHGTLEVRSP